MSSLNIIICGVGEVGGHTAEVLAGAGHSVTVIDTDPERLRAMTEALDVRTLEGNAASSIVLRDAGAHEADVVIAATNVDEANIVAASVSRALGARKSVARLHHRAFFDQRDLDYEKHFGIDRLLCPEYSTAHAIARSLRNPAALAIENFAGQQIDMHEFPVSENAPAVGHPLEEVRMPKRTRLAAVRRGPTVLLPDAATLIQKGDRVVLIGNSDVFDDARKQFRIEKPQRQKVVMMGGTPMAVWLCRALRARAWSIRLFETRRARAEELADKLNWVTVLNTDPTDQSVFAEERIGLADVFVALLDHDEDNIVGSVLAKAGGVTESIAVVQRSRYLDLLYHIGVDRSYSPGMAAAKEILELLDESPLRLTATLAGDIKVYIVRVGPGAAVKGQALRNISLSPDWAVGAVKRGDEVWVPGADDVVKAGDSLLLIGRSGRQQVLHTLFVGD